MSNTGWLLEDFEAYRLNSVSAATAARSGLSSPRMRWICFSGIPSGAKISCCAMAKLLSGSVGGTHRSSPQKKWTEGNVYFCALARVETAEEKAFAIRPPERATQ